MDPNPLAGGGARILKENNVIISENRNGIFLNLNGLKTDIVKKLENSLK